MNAAELGGVASGVDTAPELVASEVDTALELVASEVDTALELVASEVDTALELVWAKEGIMLVVVLEATGSEQSGTVSPQFPQLSNNAS